MSSSIFVSSWLLSPVGITLGSNTATWFDPSLLRINPFSRVRCWIPAFFALITACSTASGVRSQDISTPLNRNGRVAACTFPSSSRQTYSQWYDTEQLKYSMLKYSSLQTGTLKLGMLWIGGYLNLPQLITDYHDRHPLVTCHLDVEGSKTLFHMLKARDLHAIFIIGSEKQLRNQSVWYCNTACLQQSGHWIFFKLNCSPVKESGM